MKKDKSDRDVVGISASVGVMRNGDRNVLGITSVGIMSNIHPHHDGRNVRMMGWICVDTFVEIRGKRSSNMIDRVSG